MMLPLSTIEGQETKEVQTRPPEKGALPSENPDDLLNKEEGKMSAKFLPICPLPSVCFAYYLETDDSDSDSQSDPDTRGLQEGVELPKHYFSFADGFVLVYSVNNLESFQRVELLKKEIDKFKDKKEVAIVVLGNKIDLSEQRQVDAEVAQQWARSEKVRLWEVTVTDRKTLIEPFTLLASKLSQPQSKSSFPLPGRKNKGNSSSEN